MLDVHTCEVACVSHIFVVVVQERSYQDYRQERSNTFKCLSSGLNQPLLSNNIPRPQAGENGVANDQVDHAVRAAYISQYPHHVYGLRY